MNINSTYQSINCGGYLLSFDKVKVMGILNVTPDSFYDGGHFQTDTKVLSHVEKMLSDGADIIDVGGMSSRPGAEIIDEAEELKRVLPVIKQIVKKFPKAKISIDTVKAEVARQAILEGARIINDISAGNIDAKMFETVANLQVPYILMHMLGKPKTMQNNPNYDKNITQEIIEFFVAKIEQLETLGVKDIVLDVGFGFGKTIAHNYQIMSDLCSFTIFEKPILVGVSRKSMIYKLLDCTPEEALNGTSVLHSVAIQNGASLLRVHDVKEAVETIKIMEQLNAK